MNAFRSINGNIVEVLIDVDPNGMSLLPPNTTVEPKPEALEGHRLDIMGTSWIQVPVVVHVKSFEELRLDKLAELRRYRDWIFEQPTEHAGVLFDADDKARVRISQTVTAYQAFSELPPGWVTYDNQTIPLATFDDLKAIAVTIFTTFNARFFECNTMRDAISVAETEEALDAVVIPTAGLAGMPF